MREEEEEGGDERGRGRGGGREDEEEGRESVGEARREEEREGGRESHFQEEVGEDPCGREIITVDDDGDVGGGCNGSPGRTTRYVRGSVRELFSLLQSRYFRHICEVSSTFGRAVKSVVLSA